MITTESERSVAESRALPAVVDVILKKAWPLVSVVDCRAVMESRVPREELKVSDL